MGNHATPSRSFNTVKHSNRDKRVKRQRQQRMILNAIFAVVAVILLCLFIFVIGMIVDTVSNGKEKNPNDGLNPSGNQQGTQDVTYISVTQMKSAVHTGELLVVNSQNQYHFPSVTTGLKTIADNRLKYEGVSNTYMVGDTSWKLHSAALDALNSMMYKHYELFEDGSVSVSSAYRSYEDQDKLNSSTVAGYSDHHTGLCVALKGNAGKGTLEDDHWIYQNCHKYGFVVRYPDEKSTVTGVSGYEYCLRYVGVAHATYMYNNGLCLEEYAELIRNTYTTNNHLKLTGADGKNYEVYYVPAADTELTTLQVPKNYQYTISGDNIGGFIVTVCLDAPTNA